MIVKGLYTILLGIFLTLFVGIGITTFYPEPIYPTPTPCLAPTSGETAPAKLETQSMDNKCEQAQILLNNARNRYVQIISSISLVCAVLYLVTSFTLLKKVEVFSYGFLFGCMFTLLYSVATGLGSNQAPFKFILICFSLAIVMWVGYRRFIQSSVKK